MTSGRVSCQTELVRVVPALLAVKCRLALPECLTAWLTAEAARFGETFHGGLSGESPRRRGHIVGVHRHPIARAIIGLPGINQLERSATAVGERGPRRIVVVADPSDHDILVRRRAGLEQGQCFASVVE